MNFEVLSETALPEEPQIIIEEETTTQSIAAIVPENTDVLFTVNASDSRMRTSGTTVQQWGYGCLYGSSVNSEVVQARDAIYAINNNGLYEYVDSLTNLTDEESSALNNLTQSILENMSAMEA